MKKQALLAVSALSLGVVGLATFTPVVSAATSSNTSKVQVTVSDLLGLSTSGAAVVDPTANAFDVTVDEMGAQAASTGSKTLYAYNNKGTANLTVADADDKTDLVSGTDTIATNSSAAAGTEGWAVKSGDSTGTTSNSAMPDNTSSLLLATVKASEGIKGVEVTYTVGTDYTTPSGTYSDTVNYTITRQ